MTENNVFRTLSLKDPNSDFSSQEVLPSNSHFLPILQAYDQKNLMNFISNIGAAKTGPSNSELQLTTLSIAQVQSSDEVSSRKSDARDSNLQLNEVSSTTAPNTTASGNIIRAFSQKESVGNNDYSNILAVASESVQTLTTSSHLVQTSDQLNEGLDSASGEPSLSTFLAPVQASLLLSTSKHTPVSTTQRVSSFQQDALHSEPEKTCQRQSQELKRLSDSSGYCAFDNITDKRERRKVLALCGRLHLGQSSIAQSISDTLSGPIKQASIAAGKSRRRYVLKYKRSHISSKNLQKKTTKQTGFKKSPTYRILTKVSQMPRIQIDRDFLVAPVTSATLPKDMDPVVAASFDTNGAPTIDHVGRSSLHVAMSSSNEGTLEFVIRLFKGKNALSCRDNSNVSPLHLACSLGNVKGVELLLIAGATPNEFCGKDNSTPLHEAVLKSSLPIIKLLLDYGADITAIDKNRLTVLGISPSSEIHSFICAFKSRLNVDNFIVKPIVSNRRMPTILVLNVSPDNTSSLKQYVLQSELCSFLGISKDDFDTQLKAKLSVSDEMTNSEMASRIINPQLKSSFERTFSQSDTSILVEVDESLRSILNTTDLKIEHAPACSSEVVSEDSDATVSMSDMEIASEEEHRIRIDDMREAQVSLEKFENAKEARKRVISNSKGFLKDLDRDGLDNFAHTSMLANRSCVKTSESAATIFLSGYAFSEVPTAAAAVVVREESSAESKCFLSWSDSSTVDRIATSVAISDGLFVSQPHQSPEDRQPGLTRYGAVDRSNSSTCEEFNPSLSGDHSALDKHVETNQDAVHWPMHLNSASVLPNLTATQECLSTTLTSRESSVQASMPDPQSMPSKIRHPHHHHHHHQSSKDSRGRLRIREVKKDKKKQLAPLLSADIYMATGTKHTSSFSMLEVLKNTLKGSN